ncbi:MAG: hypothetical protein ACLQU1_35010 [Bryobacteraceae bacterium]
MQYLWPATRKIFIIIKFVPRGPSDSRYTDPAFAKAVVEGLRRYKNGGNPGNKILKNKDLSKILKVSEPQISRLLRDAKGLSAITLAMALKAGVSVDYDHLELSARSIDEPDPGVQPSRTALADEQISFTFETDFVCEKTADGLTVKRKGPVSSSALSVQVKVG